MRKPPTKARRRESSPRETTDSSGTETNTVLEAASAFVTQPAGGEERPTGENEERERQRKRRKAGSMSAPISQRSQSSKAEMMERPLQSPAYYRLSRQSEPDTGANRFFLLSVEKKKKKRLGVEGCEQSSKYAAFSNVAFAVNSGHMAEAQHSSRSSGVEFQKEISAMQW